MTAPHYADAAVTLWHGDALRILPTLPDQSVDAVCTDPPYELGFMGRAWDGSGIAYRVDLWEECLRVLKPGGHLLAFGGTRTSHRLTCAIEDAGFEIRDTITWLYGSGFPKSHDVAQGIEKRLTLGADRRPMRGLGKTGHEPFERGGYAGDTGGKIALTTEEAARWDGWGTALKPASEPVVVARKPLTGTVAATVLAYGTGALNIDACRVDGPAWTFVHGPKTGRTGGGIMGDPAPREGTAESNPAGRWPANVVLTHPQADDGGDACADGCVPGCPVADLDTQSGKSRSARIEKPSEITPKERPWGGGAFNAARPARGHDDEGGASRFFPTFRYQAKADTTQRPRAGQIAHPTVKPLDLMRWLVRLVTPPGGTVLDPFAGSGTTGEACTLEGFHALLVEREADYLPLIVDRLTRRSDPVAHLTAKAARGEAVDLGLFADLEEGA